MKKSTEGCMADKALRTYLLVLLTAFAALVLLSWPILFSFDLWVLKDRGNLLNVDYLLGQHLRLGLDAYYIYGLLPVWLQHAAFSAWGRGFWPLLAFDVPYVLLSAYFWAWFVSRTPQPRLWLWAAVALSPILLWVNPNFPYVLVQLSLLFSLLLIYERRLSAALCVAVVGCYSVPSLPFVAAATICVLIVLDWWLNPQRTLAGLVRAFAPAAAVFLLLAIALGAVFSFESVRVTLFPMMGATFYQSNHYGLFTRGSGLDFIAPLNAGWRYYLANRAGWWIAGTLTLFGFAAIAVYTSVRQRKLTSAAAVILSCAVIHAVFAFYVYSVPPQHVIYDPVLVAGTLAGLAWLPLGAWRNILAVPLLGLGVLGSWAQVHETYADWRETRVSPETAGLYAQTTWVREWSGILHLADQRRVLFLSYGTGVHNYFPALESPDSWTLQWGQMLPGDLARLQARMAAVDVVVEDLSGPTRLIENMPQITQALDSFCLGSVTPNFKTYWKRTPSRSGTPCAPPSASRPDPGTW
jgi:hypothetical protein